MTESGRNRSPTAGPDSGPTTGPGAGPGPGPSVVGSTIAGPNIQIGGSFTGDLVILLDRPDYRLEFLTPTPAETDRLSARARRQPSYLLDPQHQVVPYTPRPIEQQRIRDWLDNAEPLSVLLLTGAGGQGKTRLAGHIATGCYRDGWAVAQAVERSPQLRTGPTRPGGPETDAVADQERPLLVVLDYAERWRLAVLTQLVESLPMDSPGRRLRVLLLARPGPGLWDTIAAQLDRSGADLPDPLALGGFDTDRTALFGQAADAFAARLQVPTAPPPPAAVLADTAYGSPLTLHMAALAAVCTDRDPAPPGDRVGVADLSRFLLRHERRGWTAIGHQHGAPAAEVVEQVVVWGTLLGPVTSRAAAIGLLRRAGLADGDAHAATVLTAYERLYPAPRPDRAQIGVPVHVPTLVPLRPDRLGEDLVGLHLGDHPHTGELLSELLTQLDPAIGLDELGVRRCLIVLAAAAARHDTAAATVFGLLDQQPELVRHAGAAVVQLVADHAPDPVAATVHDALPRFSTELLRPAAALARRLCDTPLPDASLAQRARRLGWLGIRLAEVGDKRGALAPTEEAVTTYRRLAEAEPASYLPDLAGALTNLGVRLSQVGDKRGALAATEEAVTTYRRLAEAEPAAYLPDLAGALTNLGIWLSQVGDKRGALAPTEEAVTTYRRLAETEPAAYLPDLAMSLNNLGIRLSQVGDKRGALAPTEEAVTTYRRLAETEPAAYLPDLANALTNLGGVLSEVGDKRGALAPTEEAVTTYRRLAEAEPAAYLPDLAGALNSLGIRLSQVGDKRGALAPTEEAVTIRRRLAEAEPAAYLPDLAGALNNLGIRLSEVGDKRGALAPTEEAVTIRRRLAEAEPAAYLPDLAGALTNLGIRLSEVGDTRGALAPTEEAVTIRRRLAEAEPAAYLPALAMGLWAFGWVRAAGGQELDAALCAAEEATAIYESLAHDLPQAFAGLLRTASLTRADVLDGLGRTNEAEELRRQLRTDQE